MTEICRVAGCALIGGETAELPGIYREGELDFAGTCVGVVAESELVDGSSVVAGDVVIGFPSSGVHANGLTLARRALAELGFEARPPELDGGSVADALLEPTVIYVRGDARGVVSPGDVIFAYATLQLVTGFYYWEVASPGNVHLSWPIDALFYGIMAVGVVVLGGAAFRKP